MPVASDSNDDHHLCNVTTFFCTPTFSFSVSQRVFNAVSTFAHTLNIFLQCSSCNYRQCRWWLMVLRLNNVIRGKTTLFVSLEHPRASHTNFHSTISQGNARALFFSFFNGNGFLMMIRGWEEGCLPPPKLGHTGILFSFFSIFFLVALHLNSRERYSISISLNLPTTKKPDEEKWKPQN